MDAIPPPSPEAPNLAERALEMILYLIRQGELAPGAELNELDLARRFGMSRGPVREAVRRLQGRKLVTREPYLRARIAALGLEELREIFELRECLEGMACRLATERLPDAVLRANRESMESPATPAFDFHVAVAQGCGNARIAELLSVDLYDLVRLYRWRSGAVPGRREEARQEHWQIARAMEGRDALLAESLMRAHIRSAWRILEADVSTSCR
ncbi:GntR family transcriptional regulator [Falsiroseomonas sp.]|uniref:GntR family transcriptional regulator n=1 Tax=Falsiroseomonas sp. TaxID=2870721 RepID=UPI003F6E7CC3